jgi:hypothetical protein
MMPSLRLFGRRVLPTLIVACCASTCEAGFEKIGIGCRALGMGSAFVAVANNVSAIYWNPAGLALAHNQANTSRELSLMYSPLFGLSYLQHKFAGYTQSRLSDRVDFGALGLGIIELDLSPDADEIQPLSYVENTFLLAWAYSFSLPPIFSQFALGATAKYYNLQTSRAAFGYGADLGLLGIKRLSVNDWKMDLRIGIVVQDIGTSPLWYRGGPSPERKELIESHYRSGAAIALEHPGAIFRHVLIAAEVHRRDKYALQRTEVNLGTELRLISEFDLRLGIQQLDEPRYAFGFGIGTPNPVIGRLHLTLEASWLTHPDLNNTLTFSLSLHSGRKP